MDPNSNNPNPNTVPSEGAPIEPTPPPEPTATGPSVATPVMAPVEPTTGGANPVSSTTLPLSDSQQAAQSSRKKLIFIVIIVVLLLAAAGAVYALYIKPKPTKNESNNTGTNTNSSAQVEGKKVEGNGYSYVLPASLEAVTPEGTEDTTLVYTATDPVPLVVGIQTYDKSEVIFGTSEDTSLSTQSLVDTSLNQEGLAKVLPIGKNVAVKGTAKQGFVRSGEDGNGAYLTYKAFPTNQGKFILIRVSYPSVDKDKIGTEIDNFLDSVQVH